MVEDDPDFRWSNAWWAKMGFGIAAPAAFALAGVAALILGKAYAVGWLGRRLSFLAVEGFPARLMAGAYLGTALALFAAYYARSDRRWNPFADLLLGIGLLVVLVGLGWCAWLVLTGEAG
jgi:hypothetical protein